MSYFIIHTQSQIKVPAKVPELHLQAGGGNCNMQPAQQSRRAGCIPTHFICRHLLQATCVCNLVHKKKCGS